MHKMNSVQDVGTCTIIVNGQHMGKKIILVINKMEISYHILC